MIFGELIIPRYIGYIIDNVVPMKSIEILIEKVAILIIVVIIILIVKAVYNLLQQIISLKITKNQQIDLIKHLQRLGFSYYEKVSTGQILSLFENSVRETQQTYTFLFPQFIYSFVQFMVPSVMLIIGEPRFFLAAMVGNVIYIVLNNTTNKKINYYLGIETEAANVSQQSLYDTIIATTELKAMGQQDWFIDKSIEDLNKYKFARMKSIFWRHFRFSTVGFTLTISTVLFYLFGLDLIKSGAMTLGEFIGYSFLMGVLSRGFSVLFYILPAQYHALNYAKHLYDFLKLEPDVCEVGTIEHKVAKEDIELRNISFSYNENVKVLNNISLKISAGKKVAIVGESGSGKSTLLKLIGRFYDVTKGEIFIDNYDIRELSLENLRSNFGFVFQDTYLFDMSIKDNIKFGNLDVSDDEVVAAAKNAGAHDFIINTQNGYDTVVGERGVLLSGGQKQRIAIARMILSNPKIILLDEATSALDNVTEVYIKETFSKLFKDKTVITVAHRLSTIKDYDLIVVLENGAIVEKGSYEELVRNKSLFYKLLQKGGEIIE